VIIRLRILLIVAGIVAFTIAQRTGVEWVRWIAVALVGASLLLRFLRR
jgi:TRAP-type uncharacterized transport system fused permease subunit